MPAETRFLMRKGAEFFGEFLATVCVMCIHSDSVPHLKVYKRVNCVDGREAVEWNGHVALAHLSYIRPM
jgi:hypothetical protein